MSNFSWTRPLGVWNPGVIRASELQDLDRKSAKTANFTDGSTHAPSSPVIVGGAGMTLTLVGVSTLAIGASLSTSGFSTISIAPGGQFFMNGEALFSGDTYITGGNWSFSIGTHTTFDAGSFLNVQGTAAFSGTVTAASIEVFSIQVGENLYVGPDSVANLGGSLSVAEVAHFHDDLHVHENTYLEGTIVSGNLALSGAGAIQERVVIGANADSTYSVSSADLVYIPLNGVTGPRTYYLDEVGADNGKKIRFHREDNHADRPITLRRSSDGSPITILNWDITGQIWTDVQRIAGVWQRVAGEFWTN